METSSSEELDARLSEIENHHLRSIVADTLKAKRDNVTFWVHEEPIRFTSTSASKAQLVSYEKSLILWAEDPVNPSYGNDGHAFDMFLGLVLKDFMGKNDKNTIVRNAPYTLDFLEKNESERIGPSADIIIGKPFERGIIPSLLIDAKVGKVFMRNGHDHEPRVRNQANLHVPVLSVYGDELFGDGKNMTYQFGMSRDPMSFVKKISAEYRPNLQKVLSSIPALYFLA